MGFSVYMADHGDLFVLEDLRVVSVLKKSRFINPLIAV